MKIMTHGRLLAFILLLFGLMALLAVRQDDKPLLIDASVHHAGGAWCDVPPIREPLILPRGLIRGKADEGDIA